MPTEYCKNCCIPSHVFEVLCCIPSAKSNSYASLLLTVTASHKGDMAERGSQCQGNT